MKVRFKRPGQNDLYLEGLREFKVLDSGKIVVKKDVGVYQGKGRDLTYSGVSNIIITHMGEFKGGD